MSNIDFMMDDPFQDNGNPLPDCDKCDGNSGWIKDKDGKWDYCDCPKGWSKRNWVSRLWRAIKVGKPLLG